MRVRLTSSRGVLLALVVIIAILNLSASQAAPEKKRITHDVYDRWRSIQGTKISRDGTWLVYALTPQDGDGELVVRNLKTDAETRQPRGRDAVITADDRFVVFTIAPLKADVDKAKKEKKKPEEQPKTGLGILDLATGKVRHGRPREELQGAGGVGPVRRVPARGAGEEGGRDEARGQDGAGAKPEEKASRQEEGEEEGPGHRSHRPGPGDRHRGDDHRGRRVRLGQERQLARVRQSRRPKTPEKDGAFVRRMADGAAKTLLSGLGHYKGFAFDEAGDAAGVRQRSRRLQGNADASRSSCTTGCRQTRGGAPRLRGREASAAAGMPAGRLGVERERHASSSRRTARGCSSATAPAPKAEPEDAPEPVKVDIWNWKDPLLQPMQKVRAEEEKKRSYRAVVHLKDKRFVPLASPDMPDLTPERERERRARRSDVPYRQLVSWDARLRRLLRRQPRRTARAGSSSRRRASARRSRPAATISSTSTPRTPVVRRARQRRREGRTSPPSSACVSTTRRTTRRNRRAPWGVGGMDRRRPVGAALRPLRHLGGEAGRHGAKNVTSGLGRKQKLVFRYRRLDPEEKTIKPDKPLLLSATDDTTKATGYYRVRHSPAPREPAKVVMLDKACGSPAGGSPGGGGFGGRGPLKAKNADALVCHAAALRGVPEPVGQRRRLREHAEGDRREPAAGRLRLGHVGAHRLRRTPTARRCARS